MRGVLAGAGAREALERGGDGRVVASFRRACYLALGGGQIVLVAPGVEPGPVHVVLDAEPPRPEPGGAIRVTGTVLVVDGVRIDVGGATPWWGSLPEPVAVREHAFAIASAALEATPGSALLREPFEGRARRARTLLEEGRLQEAASGLAGLGPGLTPSGDDALAGIVFALRAALGPGIETSTVRAADALPAGSLGRDFVSFAARGQALAPVHDLVERVVAGDRAGADGAARGVASIGETSGRDLLLGLGWALTGGAVYEVAASEGLTVGEGLAIGDPAVREGRTLRSR